MKCEAHLPIGLSPRLTVSNDGWHVAAQDLCGQRVGLRVFWDAVGQQRHYCAAPGHERDVRRRAEYDDALRMERLERLVGRTT